MGEDEAFWVGAERLDKTPECGRELKPKKGKKADASAWLEFK
jgi:hypothetical protein